MADLHDDLAEVLLAIYAATRGPWHGEVFEQIYGKGQFFGGLILGSDDETIIAQCVMPHNEKAIVNSFNFIRTHANEIERNARDAERYRWLRDHATTSQVNSFGSLIKIDAMDQFVDMRMREGSGRG